MPFGCDRGRYLIVEELSRKNGLLVSNAFRLRARPLPKYVNVEVVGCSNASPMPFGCDSGRYPGSRSGHQSRVFGGARSRSPAFWVVGGGDPGLRTSPRAGGGCRRETAEPARPAPEARLAQGSPRRGAGRAASGADMVNGKAAHAGAGHAGGDWRPACGARGEVQAGCQASED